MRSAGADVALVGLWPSVAPFEPLANAPTRGPEIPQERRDGDDAVVLGRNAKIEARLGVVTDEVCVPAEGPDARTGVGTPSGVVAAGRLVRFGALGSEVGEGDGLTRDSVGVGDPESTGDRAGGCGTSGGVTPGRDGGGASTGSCGVICATAGGSGGVTCAGAGGGGINCGSGRGRDGGGGGGSTVGGGGVTCGRGGGGASTGGGVSCGSGGGVTLGRDGGGGGGEVCVTCGTGDGDSTAAGGGAGSTGSGGGEGGGVTLGAGGGGGSTGSGGGVTLGASGGGGSTRGGGGGGVGGTGGVTLGKDGGGEVICGGETVEGTCPEAPTAPASAATKPTATSARTPTAPAARRPPSQAVRTGGLFRARARSKRCGYEILIEYVAGWDELQRTVEGVSAALPPSSSAA